ncbi:MAG: glucuronoxylanase XynC [bacterium]|nr:glucuronoxylanase XynC [bacterium]
MPTSTPIGGSGSSSPAAIVDFGASDQIIRGFGGSTAFLGTLTTQQATALFSPTNGLGLSILRVRIDPDGSAAGNWVTTQWSEELLNATEARAANPNAIIFATPWTPPTIWKASSSSQPYYSGSCRAPGLCGGYLDPSHYADYAAYLEDFVQYFQRNGVPLYAVSMQNEPDFSGQDYESCSWTPAEMDTWVANDGAAITTRLIMPESYHFDPAQAAPTLNDPNAVDKVTIVGGHLYGAQPSYDTQAESLGKDVWMTEHRITPAAGATTLPTMADAINAAEEIHNSMVTGRYNAYVWWWVWNDPNDGNTRGLIDSDTTNPSPTFFGDAMGQYSKFIQPGYHRYDATANPSGAIYVSAYSGSGHYVIVAINGGSSAVNQTFTIQNATLDAMTPWQTTAAGGLQQQSPVPVSNGSFTYALPAQSITTFAE